MHLVVGATGSLGGAIAHRLIARGLPVRALARRGSDVAQLEAAGAEIAEGDLKEPRSLTAACEGATHVLASATAAMRGGEDSVEAVDIAGYRHLIAAAERQSVEQFVFVSAYGFDAGAPVALARAKAGTERALEESALNYTILRPVLFMESWIEFLLGAQLEQGDTLSLIGSPARRYSFVSADDVASLAVAALGREESRRQAIPLSAGAASYGEIVEWVRELSDRDLALHSVNPGPGLPFLPPIVNELWNWAAQGVVEDVETPEVARRFGLTLETPREFVERWLAGSAAAPP